MMSRCGAAGGAEELELVSDKTYSVFPRFSVLNMSGNRLITFLSKLLLFTLAIATAALNAAWPLTPLSIESARCPDTDPRISRVCFNPSANGCKIRVCLALVCADPLCSMRTGPASAVASLTGCTNLVKNWLPDSSVTSFPSTVPTWRTVASNLGLNPLVNFPPVFSMARNPPASSSLAALLSALSWLWCVNS